MTSTTNLQSQSYKVNYSDDEEDPGVDDDLTSGELRRHRTDSVTTSAKRVFLVTYNLLVVVIQSSTPYVAVPAFLHCYML